MSLDRHLYRDSAGSRLPPVIVPEIARAQKRLERLAARHGADAAVRAYDLARHYLRDDWTRGTVSIRGFGSLPDDIREQASWGRLLSDPEWGWPLPQSGIPRKILFIDIIDAYERSAA